MNHRKKIEKLQNAIKEAKSPLSLKYGGQSSNTTRNKSYNKRRKSLDFSNLNEILAIDTKKQVAVVEPRVTMETLVKKSLEQKLFPLIVPEFKGITVGGAIMGAAAESSSHQFGIFNDSCRHIQILGGDGSLIEASPQENPPLFYGIAGSYGSLGALTQATIALRPAKEFVHLRYHVFNHMEDAVKQITSLQDADFVDGIIFSEELCVVIEGRLQERGKKTFTTKWYYQKVPKLKEESLPLYNYLFRYDQGAFWMGAYLYNLSFFSKFLRASPTPFGINESERYQLKAPSFLKRFLTAPFMNSQSLWKLLHQNEKWIADRFIIQDFCIPSHLAKEFLLENPGIYPLWLCPIKGTKEAQIFAPHYSPKVSSFINVGMYGLPKKWPVSQVTKELEEKTKRLGGRKVLYSHSYYTAEEFWDIYPKEPYLALREKTQATGVWLDIIDKVLL